MNIQDWPMDQIMQLPDCCFGRRFPVCVSGQPVEPSVVWDISELGLPEVCVLWELLIDIHLDEGEGLGFRLALGDQLPTTAAMMDALEPLIPGLGFQGPEPRVLTPRNDLNYHLVGLRLPIASAGRRLVLEVGVGIGILAAVNVAIVVSSIPTEVPDCLISEYLRSQ